MNSQGGQTKYLAVLMLRILANCNELCNYGLNIRNQTHKHKKIPYFQTWVVTAE
jgi:hypothetical protein